MPDDYKLPPPSGDSQRADSYVTQLTGLISQNKLRVVHTDLSKFDPSSLHDHYSLDLKEYQVEISHSKQPTTGRDSYVVLFNNIKNLEQDETKKEILAYLIITEEQFKKLKDVADEQIETLKRIDEEKRFKAAMTPVDELINKISKGEVDLSKPAQPLPEITDQKVEPTETTIMADQMSADTKTEPTLSAMEIPTPQATPEPTPYMATADTGSTAEEVPAIATPDTKLTPAPETKMASSQPLSPLAAAEALPLPKQPEATAVPIVEEIDHLPISNTSGPITSYNPTPAPDEASTATVPLTPPQSAATPLAGPTEALGAQPTLSIAEVQKALADAYAKSPPAPIPSEYRPGLESLPQNTNSPTAFNSTINTIPSETSNPSAPPQIDHAIDQAFQPAQNALLSH